MTSTSAGGFPFAALVGQEELQLALLLNIVDPTIGGVLVRGTPGTAKTTAARAVAELLPAQERIAGCPFGCGPDSPATACESCTQEIAGSAGLSLSTARAPFVTLPLGATEDRVLGSLDLDAAFRSGVRRFQPGLLAAANRGILYVDEVNLLPDHLVDVILEVASTGVHTVERETLSVTHPARFALVGTMNPEEGELRPQLCDRFGLRVDAARMSDLAARAEVVRRRTEYESDPEGFCRRWLPAQQSLVRQLVEARASVAAATLGDREIVTICRVALAAGVEGHRPDLVMGRAARAHAALVGRRAVERDDIVRAARLVLPYRADHLDHATVGQVIVEAIGGSPDDDPDPIPPGHDDRPAKAGPRRGSPAATLAEPPTSRVDQPAAPANAVLAGEPGPGEQSMDGHSSPPPARLRRRRAIESPRGAQVAARPDPRPPELAVERTLLAAALHDGRAPGDPLRVTRDDLHRVVRASRPRELLLLVIDASWSMAARARLDAVKGALVGLVDDAYTTRSQLAVAVFQGDHASLAVAPTRSRHRVKAAIGSIRAGGRTPLDAGLRLAASIAARALRRDDAAVVHIVIVTDAEQNVAGGQRGRGTQVGVDLRLPRRSRGAVRVTVVDPSTDATVPPTVAQLRAQLDAGLLRLRVPPRAAPSMRRTA